MPFQDGAGAEEGAQTEREGGVVDDEGEPAAEEQKVDGVQQGDNLVASKSIWRILGAFWLNFLNIV